MNSSKLSKMFLPMLILGGALLGACSSSNKGLDPVNRDNIPTDTTAFGVDSNLVIPELKIDGIKDEEQWKGPYASEVLTFCDTYVRVEAQFYRGENALYGFFDVLDSNLCVLGDNNGDDVVKSDSVEVYLDCLNDGGSRPRSDDFQFNLGVHGKTRILVGNGEEWGVSTAMCQYEVKLDGTLNDESDIDVGYCVELMVPYKQLSINRDSVVGMALGRVDRYGVDKTAESEWFGVTVDGVFAEPQTIDNYFSYNGNNFIGRYSIHDPIAIEGRVLDETSQPIVGATITAGNLNTITDENGHYELGEVNANESLTFTIGKTGYKTKTYKLNASSMYVQEEEMTLDFTLLSGSGEDPFVHDFQYVGETTKIFCKDEMTPIGHGPFYVSRKDSLGVCLKAVTNREAFSNDEQIEFYIDTLCTPRTERDEHIFQINVLGNKVARINDFDDHGFNRCNVTLEIEGNVMTVFVPYEFLGVNKGSTLSFCYGIYSNLGLDWSPMSVEGVEHSVEKPNEYIKIN